MIDLKHLLSILAGERLRPLGHLSETVNTLRSLGFQAIFPLPRKAPIRQQKAERSRNRQLNPGQIRDSLFNMRSN